MGHTTYEPFRAFSFFLDVLGVTVNSESRTICGSGLKVVSKDAEYVKSTPRSGWIGGL